MSTAPIPTSEIRNQPGKRSTYVCPECDAKYPGRFALGVHREKKHGIKNDWEKRVIKGHKKLRPSIPSQPVKAGAKVIATADLVVRNGKLKCPECGKSFDRRVTMAVHRSSSHGIRGTSKSSDQYRKYAAKRAEKAQANGSGAILTSQILFKHGGFKCPECGRKFSKVQPLGMHRHFSHGITGQYAEKHQLVQKRQPKLLKGAQSNEHPANHEKTERDSPSPYITAPAQLIPPNGAGRKAKAAWTNESRAGFIYAHVHSFIEDACAGDPNAVADVAQRISDLLHLEVSGQASRHRHLGLLHRMP